MAKQPWLKFYPSDWRGAARLRLCSLGARGLLIEMMAIMHESDRYGYLEISGLPLDDTMLATQVGSPKATVVKLRTELEQMGVIERDGSGTIFNARMIRDEAIRKRRAEGGDSSTREPKKRPGSVGQLFNDLLGRWGGCLWCSNKIGLELHRIVPGRKGGKYECGNVVLLCRPHHDAIEDGDLDLGDILAKCNVTTAAALFAPETPAKAISPIPLKGNGEGYPQIPDARYQMPEPEKETTKTKKKALRGTQLPDDWTPNETHTALAARHPGITVGGEVDKFRDYHISKGSVFKDWDAAFRTWLRNAAKFASNRPPASVNEKPQSNAPRSEGWHSAAGQKLETQDQIDDRRVSQWRTENPDKAHVLWQECVNEIAELFAGKRGSFTEVAAKAMCSSKFRARVIAEHLTPRLSA